MDFIESGKLATDAVKFFVLDEADRLLDSGSQDLVMKLFSKLPKAATGTQRLQVCNPPSSPPLPPPPRPLVAPLSCHHPCFAVVGLQFSGKSFRFLTQ